MISKPTTVPSSVSADEVDFLTVVGSPMTELTNVLAPRSLLEEFADHERLEQVTELGQR